MPGNLKKKVVSSWLYIERESGVKTDPSEDFRAYDATKIKINCKTNVSRMCK